jgi:hypothetical protein
MLPESELRQDFARRRLRQWLVVIPAALAIIAIRVADDAADGAKIYGMSSGTIIAIAFVMIVGILVFSLWNWRCPSCSKYLGRGINPTFCGKCGFKLKD